MKNILLIVPYIILFSCTSNSKNEVKEVASSISINIDESEPLRLSVFFENVQYISLSDSFLIGEIERAKIYDDKLFVLTNKSIIVYDINSGKTILRIRSIGKGPGEYVSLYDMLYDEKNKVIELLDMNGQKVLKYDLNGHFISEFKTSFFSFSFCKIDNLNYLFYNNNMISEITGHKLIEYNSQTSKIVNQQLPIDKSFAEYFYVVDANNFNQTPELSFYFCPSEVIYGFSENHELKAQHKIDFGKNQTPPQFYEEKYSDIADFSTKAANRSYIYHVTDFVENGKTVVLSFRKDQVRYWAMYNKKHQVTYQGDQLYDDFHFDTPFSIEYENGPFAVDEKRLCFFLQPSQLIDLIKKTKNIQNKSDEVTSIYNSPNFSEQSNPLLVICNFKNEK